MATIPRSPSISVEIEPPPDIATPVWPLVQPRPVPPPQFPTFHFTPTQFSSPHPRSQVHFAPMSPDGTASFQPEPMQICTSPETTPSSSASQHRVPGHLPTPGKEIHHLTAQVQDNWDNLFDFMKHQEKAVNELTQEQKTATSHHEKLLGDLTAKMEANQQQILTTLTAAKADSADSDQLVKAMKVMISQEMKKMECTLITEVRFMVDQLQVILQRDLRATQKNLQKDHEQLSTECNQCIIQIDKLITQVNELQTNIEEVKRPEKEMADNQRKGVQLPPSAILTAPPSPLENVPECPPIPAGKSDHLKLTFPTFGRHRMTLIPCCT